MRPVIELLGLKSLANLVSLCYYRWAMGEIDPLHPDVPAIVCRINELERLG